MFDKAPGLQIDASNAPKKFCSCKDSSKVYCVINPNTNKLHRATFSRSLAEHIVEKHCPEYEVRSANFVRGKKLHPGESSRGIYGIVSTDKDLVLRVPIRKELAEIYASDGSRHIEEIFLKF